MTPGSNPYGYTTLPWDLWNQIYGQTPRSTPAPAPVNAGGLAPVNLANYNPGINYTPPMNIPIPAPPSLPDLPFDPAASGLEFPGSETPASYDNPPGGGYVGPDELTNPPSTAFPPGTAIPGSAYPGGTVSNPPPPGVSSPAPRGDAGVVPGVDLSPNDRINMGLHGLGLPPVPTGYSPLGGLPPGMAENPNFGGGAPIFTFTNPLLNTGPQWNPGGSIFGGRGAPIVPGSEVIGNLGGSGGFLPWQTQLFHGIWAGQHPYSQATWAANAGWRNYQGRMPGQPAPGGIAGSYQNYVNTWNTLRSGGITAPGVVHSAASVKAENTGQGIGGAGRPMTSAR